MKLITALTSQRLKAIVVAGALLLAGAIGGGAISTTITAAVGRERPEEARARRQQGAPDRLRMR